MIQSNIGNTDVNDSTITNKTKPKTLKPVIEELIKKQQVYQLTKDILNEDLSSTDQTDDVILISPTEKTTQNIILEHIETSQNAVFQTVQPKIPQTESIMRSEVMEIHGIFDNNEAVLGSDGKICKFSTKQEIQPFIPKTELICSECGFTFSTEKTLALHVR